MEEKLLYQQLYAFGWLTEAYPAQDLYSPGLKKIKQYDKEKPSAQLEETLRQYFLCQFNASEAAQRLFIHRTTFIYRINKIEQISGIDLQDWKEVLGLMIAFSCDRDFNAGK